MSPILASYGYSDENGGFSASTALTAALKKAHAQGQEGIDASFSYADRNDTIRGMVVEVVGQTALIKVGEFLNFIDLGQVCAVGFKAPKP